MLNPEQLREIRQNLGFGRWKMASLLGCDKLLYCRYEDGKYRIPWKLSNKAKLLHLEQPHRSKKGAIHNGRADFLRNMPIGFESTINIEDIPRYRRTADKLGKGYKFKIRRLKSEFGLIKRVY